MHLAMQALTHINSLYEKNNKTKKGCLPMDGSLLFKCVIFSASDEYEKF